MISASRPSFAPIYEVLPAPKYFLVLEKQTHFAWTNLMSLGRGTTAVLDESGPARLITNYSIAFFDKTLRGKDAPLLEKKEDGLASYRFDPK